MKYLKLSLLLFLSLGFSAGLLAQKVGKGEVVKEERIIGAFDKIQIGGAQNAHLKNGSAYSVVIETHANIIDDVVLVIQNGTLSINMKNISKYDVMEFYITAPEFSGIGVSGASELNSLDTLRGEHLQIDASGASDVLLNVNYKNITSKVSGASELVLRGKTISHVVDASGASEMNAKGLSSESTVVEASGASECFVEAKSSLTYEVSGASEVKYVSKPETLVIRNKRGTENVVVVRDSTTLSKYTYYGDTTTVHLGGFNVEVVDGDTTKISVGGHMIIVDDDGNVQYRWNKKPRFNGHWGGVEIGINGYVTPDYNTDWGIDNDYLNLRYEKSWQVNLNVYEQNISLNKAKNMGIVTGIGMAWNNYRFSQPTYLSPDSAQIQGYYMVTDNDVFLSLKKTKLTAMYITVPVMYEIQTRNARKMKRFHFGAGVLMSARVRTHTKIYYNQANQPYYLQVPGSTENLPFQYQTPNNSQRNIAKDYNSFHLQPFKFDGMVRVGYGMINLWAQFGLNTMFNKDAGPDLYTWSAGITLVGW